MKIYYVYDDAQLGTLPESFRNVRNSDIPHSVQRAKREAEQKKNFESFLDRKARKKKGMI